MRTSFLQSKLSQAHPAVFTFVVTLAAFCVYACMYAFRKPFTAATFADGPMILGLDYKSALVIIQVIGYMMSKFLGIKVVSEMSGSKRALAILVLIGIAEVALLGFALIPRPWNAVCLFLNGLPLGMIWGLVFSFVEGRKQTEIMGLGLCASFVFSSGLVKDAGKWLMGMGVDEFWMPFSTGLVFVIPLLIFLFILSQVPPPTAQDEAERTKRAPMNGKERWAYFQKFALGLTLLVIVYTFLTAYRDFRDNFLADIWVDLRGADNEVNFSTTETPVSIIVLAGLMLIVLVKDNFKALMVNHLAVMLGVLTAGLSTYFHQLGMMNDYLWIILTGIGTYVAYIPFNSILFDRMIAVFRHVGTVGFLIYLADAFGYLGSVGVLIYKNFGAPDLSWVKFFTQISYVLAITGFLGMLGSGWYFMKKYARQGEILAKNQQPI